MNLSSIILIIGDLSASTVRIVC